jgi:hypothetical protein
VAVSATSATDAYGLFGLSNSFFIVKSTFTLDGSQAVTALSLS